MAERVIMLLDPYRTLGVAEQAPRAMRTPFEVAERGELLVPCPLVSRGRPRFAADASMSLAPWVAVNVGVGPAKLLVHWAVPSELCRGADVRVPAAYRIESSANSTDGLDGEWRRELDVTNNASRARTHVIEFDGQRWVRLTCGDGPAGVALPLERLDLHDASDGTDDCWLVLGDELAAAALAQAPDDTSWADGIYADYPGYSPVLIDETRAGETPVRTLARIGELLATHPSARHVAFAYSGATNGSAPRAEDAAALGALVSAVREQHRVPVLARCPAESNAAGDAILNRTIEAIEERHGLVSGPDLVSWFHTHPEQLDAHGRPTPAGRRALQHLWAQALDVFYVPQ